MKRFLFLLLLAGGCLGAAPALAQRHVKNLNALGLLGGITDQGYALEVTYGRLATDRNMVRFGVLTERNLLDGTRNYAAGQLSVHFAPQLFQISETLYVHVLLGGVVRYEQRDALDATDTSPTSRVVAGPEAGLEADLFLLDRLSLVGSLRKGYLFNKPLFDAWPTMGLVGVRWYLR